MSASSGEGGRRKAESISRLWADSQPGPSRCQPSRQGYCGFCRVLYSSLDQHLSSLRHLDSVRASSRGSCTVSSSGSSRTKLTLLERFLQDVLQHHPYSYYDLRPSHADLPLISALPSPRAELDEVRFSDEDSQSLGTREHLPSSDDTSLKLANQEEGSSSCNQSAERVAERLYVPVRDKEGQTSTTGNAHSPQIQATFSQSQAPPPTHKKAHRKSNRRKTSSNSSCKAPGGVPRPHTGPPLELKPGTGLGCQPSDLALNPWRSWQKQRSVARREDTFSSDHSEYLDQTIEEVIQMCCYGVTSPSHHKEETDSLQFSLPISMETQSEDWDSPVQAGVAQVQEASLHAIQSPVQVSRSKDLSQLMDIQVQLEDQVYSCQLDCALYKTASEGMGQDHGFWTLPIEQVLPPPQFIPESFRGKTWNQIEQEDEERVEKLVCQFRRGGFICYFDSESLARYGRRSQTKKRYSEQQEAESVPGVMPLLDYDDDSAHLRRRRRALRLASRCQVVKVSQSTQTVRLLLPTVRPSTAEAQPLRAPTVSATERTPETWRRLPLSYSGVVTPVQPRTSLVYLLCSPSGPAPTAAGSAARRCRRKRRPLDLQGLKVKYKPLPVRFYDPSTNRILRTPPKGPRPPDTNPPCVRQLFRSLSPDLNADKPQGVKGHTCLLSTLRRRSERGRGGRRDRTQPTPPTRRTRSHTTPPQPRREGLRRAGPTGHSPLPCTARRRRGRRRGRR